MKKNEYPPIGTVSHGTMRSEDLIPDFMDVLEAYDKKTARTIRKENADVFAWLEDTDQDEPEFLSEFVNETLWNALENIAAPYCYFGATEGDGCDYGFWPSIDNLNEDVRDGEVLKIEAGEAIPRGEKRLVMHVSDHGNVTLTTHTGREIWSCV